MNGTGIRDNTQEQGGHLAEDHERARWALGGVGVCAGDTREENQIKCGSAFMVQYIFEFTMVNSAWVC